MMRKWIGDAMHGKTTHLARCALLAAAIWLIHSHPASACELAAPDRSPLEVRKPVRGESVYFAAGFGVLLLLFELLSGRQKFHFYSLLAGIAIGLPNYFSIWCMVAALKQYPGNSSAIIPIINMGIVLSGTLAAVFFFRERLSVLNIVGIILSLGAIALITFG